ncbi:DNA glycosylase AlkZ-like family protein [Micromonospora sp. KC723]|uniref:DNA glycosylase AlkZ-like family protein n=1 Tax=Micromonospora sp. KC723 TaxID=2530381 RepID=UPI0010522C61|nr:crosslink repair DNA glycosylase YcaQ family protein [Micromonospora sp. KC723]TDB78277.1 hypothetical protein E1165_00960 [Micromonospora sp. KC723]
MRGAHAQVASAAELSVGLRVDGTTRTTVRDALWTDNTLVKTREQRHVHLLAAVDLPVLAGALSAVPAAPFTQNGEPFAHRGADRPGGGGHRGRTARRRADRTHRGPHRPGGRDRVMDAFRRDQFVRAAGVSAMSGWMATLAMMRYFLK